MPSEIAKEHCVIACRMLDDGVALKAVAQLSLAIEIDPRGLYFHHRGRAYMMLDEYRAAVSDFTADLASHPQHPEFSFSSRGLCYLNLKMFHEAAGDFSIAIQHNSDVADYYYWRGRSFEGQALWSAATKDLYAAIALDKGYRLAKESLAAIRSTCPNLEVRNGGEAVALAEELLHGEDVTWWTYAIAAAAHAEIDNWDDAISFAKLAVELSPESERRHRLQRLAMYERHETFRRSAAGIR